MSSTEYVPRTLRLRLKDKHAAWLREQARAVNTVWNFCNELSFKHWQRKRAFFSAYDRQPYTKIAHRRTDALHKLSTQLVTEHGAIFVGNVNAAGLAKTSMAKSVLDAGWSTFRTMLQYKSDRAGVWFKEVNEAYSTQTCSECSAMPASRPKGIAGLGIREWTCSECGSVHDRDTNAAKNILAVGRGRLAGGTPGCCGSGIRTLPTLAVAAVG